MGGWKTWAGVAGLVVAAGASAFGYPEVANGIYGVAAPMVVVGLGHKLDKVAGVLRMVGTGTVSLADQLDKGMAQAPKA
jgi:hypothetical protein